MLRRHRGIIGIAGGIVALAVATIYFFIVPDETAQSTGFMWLLLRYGHTVCWLLLSAAAVLWAFSKHPRLVSILAYAALVVYGIFMLALFASRAV